MNPNPIFTTPMAVILLFILGILGVFAADKNVDILQRNPPDRLEEIVAIFSSVYEEYPESVRAKTQLERWLSQFPVQKLVGFEREIPSPWSGTPLSFGAFRGELREHLETALSLHPDQTALETLRPDLAAFGRGQATTPGNWQETLQKSSEIQDEKIRDHFLLGLLRSVGRLDRFDDSWKKRKAVIALMSQSLRVHTTTYENDKWKLLWPAGALATWAETLPEDQRFNILRQVADQGSHYFSTFEEGVHFLDHFGRSGPGQLPVIAEAMGAVFAARDRDGFFRWTSNQGGYVETQALEAAIEVLLRRDPEEIKQLILHFEGSNSFSSLEVAQEWARYDPEAALCWARSLPVFKKFGESFVFNNIRPTKKISRENAIELIRKHFAVRPDHEIHLISPDTHILPATLEGSKKLRESLSALALSGATPLANLELYQRVFSLDLPTVEKLLQDFEQTPPHHARELMVQRYLLEQWVFLEPEKACEWILLSGTGAMRSLLPLAFSQMRNPDPLKVHAWQMRIPEREIYDKCAAITGL